MIPLDLGNILSGVSGHQSAVRQQPLNILHMTG